MKPCTFQPKIEKYKKSTPIKFLILQETKTPKNLLIFFSKESCSYVSRIGNLGKIFLSFRKRIFLILQKKNIQNPSITELKE